MFAWNEEFSCAWSCKNAADEERQHKYIGFFSVFSFHCRRSFLAGHLLDVSATEVSAHWLIDFAQAIELKQSELGGWVWFAGNICRRCHIAAVPCKWSRNDNKDCQLIKSCKAITNSTMQWMEVLDTIRFNGDRWIRNVWPAEKRKKPIYSSDWPTSKNSMNIFRNPNHCSCHRKKCYRIFKNRLQQFFVSSQFSFILMRLQGHCIYKSTGRKHQPNHFDSFPELAHIPATNHAKPHINTQCGKRATHFSRFAHTYTHTPTHDRQQTHLCGPSVYTNGDRGAERSNKRTYGVNSSVVLCIEAQNKRTHTAGASSGRAPRTTTAEERHKWQQHGCTR